MGKTIQVLLLILVFSMLCYFSGMSYLIVCKSPQQTDGLLASVPFPDTAQFAGACEGSGTDVISKIGDSFEYVFLSWMIVGALWIVIILRDVTQSLKHWQGFRG